jgi:hypothetical protein
MRTGGAARNRTWTSTSRKKETRAELSPSDPNKARSSSGNQASNGINKQVAVKELQMIAFEMRFAKELVKRTA